MSLNYSESQISCFDQELLGQPPPQQIQQSDAMNSESQISDKGRVCQRCMVKKVKCKSGFFNIGNLHSSQLTFTGNRHRPSCSRCAEDNSPCVYSSSKRKPGPAKGSRRKRPDFLSDGPSSDLQSQIFYTATTSTGQNFQSPPSLLGDLLSQQVLPSNSTLLTAAPLSPITIDSVNHGNVGGPPVYPQLPAAQERQLLEDFFTYIHPSIPLFNKSRFLKQYEHGGLVNPELLQTLLTVSAQILEATKVEYNCSRIEFMAFLLSGSPTNQEDSHGNILLSGFQQACLLAFYEFHQLPSKRSWQRVGELARKAYQSGLHQIDNPNTCFFNTDGSMSAGDIDEWRNVWWCIYCLDSYCNITAVTPFVVELESVMTALTVKRLSEGGHIESASSIFLPADTGLLWKTIKEVFSCHGDHNPTVHIITTTLLKAAGQLLRLWKQNPSDLLRPRFAILEDHICTVRLALPAMYLDTARNVRHNEQNADHHARLICILHLHAARLLVSQPILNQIGDPQWLQRWHGVLEHCEDIVSVVRQWKTQQCLSVDPAICFIISGVLITLHLYSKDGSIVDLELQSRINSQKDLLCLFLEQFASIWQLPRFLLASFQNFSKKFSDPLTIADIDRILRKNLGPLHQGWYKLISMTPSDFQSATLHGSDGPALSETDLNDWESWARNSDLSFLT